MREPTSYDYKVVDAWLAHTQAWWAWERLREMTAKDPLRAWRMVQVMVAYAPARILLANIAAGPVEDLMHRLVIPMGREAEVNPRFRICLGMARELPPDLEKLADRQTIIEHVPPIKVDAAPEEIELMVGWFHHSDTFWAYSLFAELTKRRPEDALFILRLLLASDVSPPLRQSVFRDGFVAFARVNFAKYQNALEILIREHEDLRQWCLNLKRSPIDDDQNWADFVRRLT
jgi:hypothetical protein